MGSVEGGGGNITPELRATYRQEFNRSVELFQKSLAEYEKADEMHKKAKFKDVMDKALNIMNEIAKACLTEREQKQKAELEKDYDKLIASESPSNFQKLNDDIENLKYFS